MDEERPKRPLTFLGGALWTLAAAIVAQLVLSLLEASHPGAEHDLVSRTACMILAQSVVVFVILRIHEPDESVRVMFAAKRPPLLSLPLAALVGAGLAVPTMLLDDLLLKRFPVGNEEKELVDKLLATDTSGKQAVVFVCVVLITPLFDELLFRGIIFTSLRKHARADLVIFATASYDALLTGNVRVIAILSLLLAVGWIRSRTDSVWPAVVTRIAFFGVAAGIEILRGTSIPTTAPYVIGGTALSAAALLAIAGLTRARDIQTSTQP